MEFFIAESDDAALKLQQANQVQAIFTDAGWPLPSVSRHQSNSGLALVAYDVQPPPRFAVVQRTYQSLDAFNNKFLGSPNVLVTRPFKPGGDMGKKVATLQSCLVKHIEALNEGRFQAGWKEIKDPLNTLGVARFTALEKTR